ncbi:MAG TPA: F0F1 ATP synthase subunit delta [Sphingomonas sp.]|uniref:F0F1 ATP synthase subunit delta n=1 Tax=Sphingomonas sp. TaxID=28214 RepID=UPI002ED8111D
METSGGIQASLGGRYAMALFELARDEKQIDAVSASLSTINQAATGSADFARLIASPIVNRTDAAHAVAGVAAELALDPLTTKFLGVLAANRRLRDLPAIMRAYRQLAANYRGETTADVISAHPLDADQLDALKTRLKAQTGKDVSIETTVDPAILGGLIVRLGSRQVDGSIRTKLNMLAHAMKG